MSNREEEQVKEITQEFLRDSIPEYILESSQALLANEELQKIDLKKQDQHWDIDGRIQSEDFQFYNPEIGIDLVSGAVNYFCNCPDSFTGICPHVGAAMLQLLNYLDNGKKESAPKHRTDWRHSFRPFFVNPPEPEPGNNYLIFRFFPEPERLQVALYRARQNKSGLSKVQNPVSLEQLIHNPDWSELSPNLPLVAQQIGQYLDYQGHRVEIPPGLLSWFLNCIKDEHYLFLEDTDQPLQIQSQSLRLQIKPQISEHGLSFEVMLSHEDKTPFSISGEKVFLYGQMPIWILWRQTFYPVLNSLNVNLIQELLQEPPIVPHSELSEFLDRVWTKIPSSNLYGQDEFLERMKPIFVPAQFNPKLFLNEEGSLLTLEIINIYETEHGEISLSSPNPEMQTGSYQFEGKSFLLRREQEKEQELLNELTSMNFQPRNNSIWFLEPEEAINFLLDSYPELVKKYRIYGEKNLNRYKVRHSQPKVVASVEQDEKDSNWFDLNLSVDYDNIQIPIDKIWKAWIQGKRYVQLKDGSYTSLPESWLKKLGHRLRAMGLDPEKPPKQKYQKFEAPVLDKLLEDLPEAQTDSFWNSLKEKLHDFQEIEQVSQPKGLNATLRPYQLQGLSFLNFLHEYGFGGILADEMGLGKTLQTLAMLQYMKEKKGLDGPHLIIVPTSVLPNWQRETQKFLPEMKQLLIYGSRREGLFREIPSSHLVLTTYALLRRDLDDLNKYQYASVILDEAQNIKNPNTITARSVRKLHTNFKVCLSGTPIENNLLELWSLFEFLMPGFLGSQNAFQKGFVRPIKEGDEESLSYLRSRVRPFILRRSKDEVAKDLPPKVENTYFAALENEQKELYASLAKRLKEQVLQKVEEKGMAQSQMSILDALLKLRQICCHPRLLKLDMPGLSTNLPSGKFEAFKDLVSGIMEDGHKVLVFSQFVQMLHIIRSWLNMNKIPYAYLDGSSKERYEQVEKFNTDPQIPIFLISLKAGGTGLNLTAADYVIHYDPWWNPAVEDQATDRTHRIGQTKKVFSYKLICESTVEEKILQLQEQKKGVADAIIPGQEQWKNLTRDDLEMLFEI
ncbi:MAG: SNF2-related protein [Desulfohalobiaceae bacterium]